MVGTIYAKPNNKTICFCLIIAGVLPISEGFCRSCQGKKHHMHALIVTPSNSHIIRMNNCHLPKVPIIKRKKTETTCAIYATISFTFCLFPLTARDERCVRCPPLSSWRDCIRQWSTMNQMNAWLYAANTTIDEHT